MKSYKNKKHKGLRKGHLSMVTLESEFAKIYEASVEARKIEIERIKAFDKLEKEYSAVRMKEEADTQRYNLALEKAYAEIDGEVEKV